MTAVISELEAIEVRAHALEIGAEGDGQALLAKADSLVEEVRNLVNLGAATFADPASEVLRRYYLTSMQRIGSLADELRGRVRGPLGNELRGPHAHIN